MTVYFDEFIVKDDTELNDATQTKHETTLESSVNNPDASLNATVDLSDPSPSNGSFNLSPPQQIPQDESPPFTFELDPQYYLYTNPIICLTFSGIQSIKLTVNNLTPTELILESNSGSDKLSSNQQRPLLELSAQFGAIKCLLCPRQIHLLTDMCVKLSEYMEAAEAAKSAVRALQRKRAASHTGKPVRGCDKRRFESLLQNDLLDVAEEPELYNDCFNSNNSNNNNDEDDENYKSILITNSGDPEASAMFYSMMSESTSLQSETAPSSSSSHPQHDDHHHHNHNFSDMDDERTQSLLSQQLRHAAEQLRTDVIVANSAGGTSQRHNMFQTFKLTFRMFSLTVLHHDPPVASSSSTNDTNKVILNIKNN